MKYGVYVVWFHNATRSYKRTVSVCLAPVPAYVEAQHENASEREEFDNAKEMGQAIASWLLI